MKHPMNTKLRTIKNQNEWKNKEQKCDCLKPLNKKGKKEY